MEEDYLDEYVLDELNERTRKLAEMDMEAMRARVRSKPTEEVIRDVEVKIVDTELDKTDEQAKNTSSDSEDSFEDRFRRRREAFRERRKFIIED